jgi:PAS domain S-box-containing protein
VADGAERQLDGLCARAVIATDMSFTITDPRRPDNPLVWVNPSFTALTGYPVDEVVGRNCRVLQGRNTDRAAVARVAEALRHHRPVTEVLLNYRRDGTAFWNEIAISPVFDREGDLVNFVGVQNDVTERVVVEQERRAALAEAEEVRAQLRMLAEATTQMTAALGVVDACERLAHSLVPELADLCAVDVLDVPGRGVPRRLAVAARDPWTRSGCAISGGCATTTWVAAAIPATSLPVTAPCSCRTSPSVAPTATRRTRPRQPSTTRCACGR